MKTEDILWGVLSVVAIIYVFFPKSATYLIEKATGRPVTV